MHSNCECSIAQRSAAHATTTNGIDQAFCLCYSTMNVPRLYVYFTAQPFAYQHHLISSILHPHHTHIIHRAMKDYTPTITRCLLLRFFLSPSTHAQTQKQRTMKPPDLFEENQRNVSTMICGILYIQFTILILRSKVLTK